MVKTLGLLLVIICTLSCNRRTQPLEVSFWYWHTPFNLSPDDVRQLQAIGVNRLFVRAGTFTHDPEGVRLGIPQKWASGKVPFKIVLVFNYDPGLLSHFSSVRPDKVAPDMVRSILASARTASSSGLAVEGVQLDIDSPTRLLPKYADLLHLVRSGLARKDWTFSATALSSWLASRNVHMVAKEVDYLVPQFYESRVALQIDQPNTISDLPALRTGLERASGLECQMYAGLAAYGHALLYDDRGRLSTVYRGLSPEDALRHPALRYQETIPMTEEGQRADTDSYVGEDQVWVKAVQPGRDRKGLGYRIVYNMPSSKLVAEQMDIVRQRAPPNCRGVILYRLPQPDDEMALALVSVRDALAGKSRTLSLRVGIIASMDPWRQVEFGGQTATMLKVTAVNTGNTGTSVVPNAVELVVRLGQPGIEEINAADFDLAEPCRLEDGRAQPSSPLVANAIRLRRSHLLPGQFISSGSIRVASKGPFRPSWSAIGPGQLTTFAGEPAK